MVRIIVACCAAELGRNRTSAELCQLLLEPIDENAHLFAQTRGRSRLAVGLGEHRHGVPLVGTRFEGADHAFQHRNIHVFEAIFEHERESRVVDVLRRETEVHKLLVFLQTTDGIKLFFDEIFNRLDVVIRHTLDVFYTLCVVFCEIGVETAQTCEEAVIERGELG